jgi:predicted DsbA family dithiol-disulfide isomerase
MAKQLTLDKKWLAQCTVSAKVTAMLAEHKKNADDAGVTRVPTFTLGQATWKGVLPHDEFMRKVDEFLAR